MINSRAELPRRESTIALPTVDTIRVEPGTLQMTIHSQGTVKAMQEIDLISEVSGRIISVAPEFVAGGRVSTGTVLLQIDPIDYEVAIAEARSALAAAKLRLSEVKVVLMRAAIEEAEAGVSAAEARLRQAKADLGNTKISAPFDAIIDSKQVDLGQYVTAGLPLMRLLSTDVAEVRLPILASDMPFIRTEPSSEGIPPAVVFKAVRGGNELSWQGVVTRLEKRVDEQTRVFHLVAQVRDPYDNLPGTEPFSAGLFVQARVEGTESLHAVRIPRSAMHTGNFVWLVENDRLHKRKVAVLRREQDHLIISEGLVSGDLLVLSRLGLMVEGTPVTLAAETN
jgi:RND family efflux transporter MFP subunit